MTSKHEAAAALSRTQRLISTAMWATGELAAMLEQSPHAWSDEDTAAALGLPAPLVSQAKRLFQQFSTFYRDPGFQLLFSHYQCIAGLSSTQAATALEWATENQATALELHAYIHLNAVEFGVAGDY